MVSITNLTRLELQAMKIHSTDYGDLLDNPGGITWVFAWMDEIGIDPKILRGIASSLTKKGLILIYGDGNEATIQYTDEGKRICKILNGVE